MLHRRHQNRFCVMMGSGVHKPQRFEEKGDRAEAAGGKTNQPADRKCSVHSMNQLVRYHFLCSGLLQS